MIKGRILINLSARICYQSSILEFQYFCSGKMGGPKPVPEPGGSGYSTFPGWSLGIYDKTSDQDENESFKNLTFISSIQL
jgi:hypothetical protein